MSYTVASALNYFKNPANTTKIQILDMASNVAVALNTLQSNKAKISLITLKDGGTPTLAITAVQLTSDAGALGLITSAYSLSVSGVTVANLATQLANPHVQSVAVSDTVSNVAAALDTLQGAAAKISGITLTDGGTPNLAITAAQLVSDAGVLGLIASAYSLSVSGVAVASLVTVLTNPHVQSVAVSDTVSNVAAALDTLQGAAAKISGITLTDGGTPTLAITAAQLTSDAGALGLITSTYNLSVSGVTVVNLTAVLANPLVLSVTVSDTASNVAAALDTLQGAAAKISGITLTDGGTPTLAITAAQLTSDAGALGLITSTYNLSVSGVTVANLAVVLANPLVLSVTVSDTASNVAAALDTLQTDVAKISAITLTDGGTPKLAITVAQLTSDPGVLGLIGSTYSLSVSGVTLANLAAVLANALVLSVTVSDTASNVAKALNTLQADDAKITGIILTDGGTPKLAITAAQLTSDAGALGLITSAYNLGVSGVTVASLATVLANPLVLSVTVSDTASNVAAALDTLQADAGKIGGITLTDGGTPTLAITAAQLTSDAGALGLIGSAYSLSVSGVTVANLAAVLANALVLSVTVSDTASNVAKALNTLQTDVAKISAITLTDGGMPKLAITAVQLTSDAGALGLITSAYSLSVSGVTVANLATQLANPHVQSVAVSDTVSNVAAALDTLQGAAAKISGITLTDGGTPTLAITAAQLTSDAGALGLITSTYNLSVSGVTVVNLTAVLANPLVLSVTVSDTASNVAKALNTLQADDAKITGIILTDGGTPTLTITYHQLVTDVHALSKLPSTYNLSVSGVALANLASVLANPHVQSVAVSDTASNVAGSLDTLQMDAAKISSIALTDGGIPTLAISAAQLVGDASVLVLISDAYNLAVGGVAVNNVTNVLANPHVVSLTVLDSASNVAALLDTLQADAGKIGGITLTDGGTPTLAITATQVVKDSVALGLITSAYSLLVSDTANNVTAVLDTLQGAVGNISSITLTDGGTPTLDITATQLTSDAGVLGLIITAYSLSVSGVTVANLANVLANGHVILVSVSDSAVNVAAALDTLQGAAAKISGIILTDGNTPTLAITAAQLTSDAGALGLLTSTCNLSVSGVTVANLAAVLANPLVLSVTVSDTASNVAAALDTLQADAAKITAITLTDGGTPTLAITATQLASDAGVLGLIGSTYNLTVSGVTVANLAGVLKNLHVASVTLSDSGSNVQAGLDTLQGDVAKISNITLTDANTPSLAITYQQLLGDLHLLSKITSIYNLSVSRVAAANLTSVLATGHVQSVVVSDTASNIAAALNTLQTNAAKISGITLTDGGTPMLTITAAQLTNDAGALAKISSAYNLSVSGVTTSNLASVLATGHVQSVAVSDTARNVAAALDTLQNNVAEISGISLLDGGTPTLAITTTQLASDAGVLGLIVSAYNLTVSGVTVANLAAVLKNLHVVSVMLSDTGSNVQAALDTLQADAAKITSITLTDIKTPTLILSATQLVSDASALAKVSSAYNLSVSGVTTSNLASVLSNSHVLPVNVSDTASNVLAALSTLQTDVAKISGITLTDAKTPTLAIFATQLVNDAAVLAKISSAYNLTVSAVTVANLAGVLANSHVMSVAVSDTASNVLAALSTLQTDVAKISGVTLTDAKTPTLAISATQLVNDAAVLAKIGTQYTLNISNELAANFAGDLGNSQVAWVAINDSKANVVNNLDTLESKVAKLLSITLTDSGTQNLSITASQYHNDATVLGKISTVYTLSISNEAAANVSADLANNRVSAVTVVDSAAHIVSNINVLESNVSKLPGITLTDSTLPTLSLNTAQTIGSLAVLNDITSSYLLSVKDSASNINGLNLAGVHTNLIEIMPTALVVALTETSHITDLNLSQIQLTGDSITEKAYGSTGVEIDIVASNGVIANHLYFANDTESQLHLLGIGNTAVHTL